MPTTIMAWVGMFYLIELEQWNDMAVVDYTDSIHIHVHNSSTYDLSVHKNNMLWRWYNYVLIRHIGLRSGHVFSKDDEDEALYCPSLF